MKNKFVRWILGLLGFSTVANSCDVVDDILGFGTAMYGCPSADYVFNTEVEDAATEEAIKGIRVSVIERGERQYWDSETGIAYYEPYIDTLASGYTLEDGTVSLSVNSFPTNEHEIAFDDVDGPANGGEYSSANVNVAVSNEDYKNPGESGWYKGVATKSVGVKLTKK